jgi:hypothetical protein
MVFRAISLIKLLFESGSTFQQGLGSLYGFERNSLREPVQSVGQKSSGTFLLFQRFRELQRGNCNGQLPRLAPSAVALRREPGAGEYERCRGLPRRLSDR